MNLLKKTFYFTFREVFRQKIIKKKIIIIIFNLRKRLYFNIKSENFYNIIKNIKLENFYNIFENIIILYKNIKISSH